MSERKSAEIKFRIAPSEKARWQAQADSEGVSLSELIRARTNAPVYAIASVTSNSSDGSVVLGVTVDDAPTGLLEYISTNVGDATCTGPNGCSSCPDFDACKELRSKLLPALDATETPAVPNQDADHPAHGSDVQYHEVERKSWMFEAGGRDV